MLKMLSGGTESCEEEGGGVSTSSHERWLRFEFNKASAVAKTETVARGWSEIEDVKC